MRRRILSSLIVLTMASLPLAACGTGSPAETTIPPVVANVAPASGGMLGGTPITIRGSGFTNDTLGVTEVYVGGLQAMDVVVESDREITCETPPGAQGPAAVSVTKNAGTGTLSSGFTYYPPPTLVSIDPDKGSRLGGQVCNLVGSGFVNNLPGDTVVAFSGKPAPFLDLLTDTTAEVVTPLVYVEGIFDVSLHNDNGTAVLVNGYNYGGPPPTITDVTPPFGPQGGGTEVTITGSGFTLSAGNTIVTFGGITAVGTTRVDDNTLMCFSPNSAVSGFVDVSVSNTNGVDTLVDGFAYPAAPTVTDVTPDTGPDKGGDSVTITGTGFTVFGAGTNIVKFGGMDAVNVVVNSDTEIVCDTPPGSPGPVAVSVQNDNGTGSLAAGYTYVFIFECGWDTVLGPTIPANDDTPMAVALNNFTFPFLGVNYSTIQVGPNGSLMFGGTSSSFTSTLLLNLPQISILQTDLQPDAQGQVHVKELSDSIVITFVNVPTWFGTNNNTFQYKLAKNGEFCLQWLIVQDTGHYHCIGPGVGAQTIVDFSTGPSSTSDLTNLYESFSGTTDMAGSMLKAVPQAGGGFTTTVTPMP